MLISCEKCSTTYTLDAALIPASGAAVQCTRCSHVFTAYPPRADGQSTILEDEPTTSRRKNPASGGLPNPGARPASQTMVFGTGAPPPQQPAPPPARPNQTMMFGGGPVAPPPQAPPPPAGRPGTSTMVFGTAAGQQLAKEPPVASAPANQTLVFGAGNAPVPPPASAKQTVVFGTAAGQQAASREPPPNAPAHPANQTMVFGQGPAPVAPPSAHQTMMFGTPAGQQMASPPPAAPAPAPNQTLVFGNQAAVPPPAARPASSTMVFGTGAANAGAPQQPPPATRPNSTMMFGKPPEAVPAATKTMTFGTPVAAKKPAVVQISADEGESEPRAESTVRVDLERMMREQGEGEGEGEGEAGAPQERTQRFAMSDIGPSGNVVTPGEGAEAVQERHNRTALFAMSTLQETTKPDAKAPVNPMAPSSEPTLGADFGSQPLSSDAVTTLPPNVVFTSTDTDPGSDPPGVSTLLEPGFDAKATLRNDGPIASTLPNLPPIGTHATDASRPIRLDLVSASDLQGVGTQPERPMLSVDAQGEDAAQQIAASGKRRSVVAIIVILLILIAAGLAVLWQLFGKQLLAPRVDPGLQQVVVQALDRFRKEDAEVRTTELERLESVVRDNPTFTDGHAALVLGLSLQYDDLQAERAVLGFRYDRLRKQLDALKDEAKKADLAKRINALASRSEDLRVPMTEALNKVDRALKAMEAASKTGSPATQASRARAFMLALRGVAPEVSDDSVTDYWVRLAQPIALLNDPKASPEALKASLEAVEKLRTEAETSSLPRPHFVAARLLIATGDEDRALEALDKAIALSGNFTAATETRKLLDKK